MPDQFQKKHESGIRDGWSEGKEPMSRYDKMGEKWYTGDAIWREDEPTITAT